jgi:hypothetical protein
LNSFWSAKVENFISTTKEIKLLICGFKVLFALDEDFALSNVLLKNPVN